MSDEKGFALRRTLCDFHIPDSLDHVEFDCKDYVERAKAAHVEYIALMGNAHFGNCFYTPRKVGRKCLGLKQDILEEMVPLCHTNGIKIAPYYNCRHNNIEAETHPDWFQIRKDGKIATGGNDALCINTSYRDYVIAQLCEMATYYEIDGFWLDQIGPTGDACYCDACRAKYREMFGKEMKLPWKEEVPLRDQVTWERLHAASARAFVADVTAKTRAIRSNLEFFWNGSGSIWNFRQSGADIIKDAACVSTEMHHPGFMKGSLENRYMRNLGRPYERMIPECLASWGDYTINTEKTLKTIAALIIANNGAMNLCSVPCPNGMNAGRQWPASWEIIGNVLGFIEEREPYVKGSKPVRDVVMLSDYDDVAMKTGMGHAYNKSTCGTAEVYGTGAMLQRDHQQIDVVNPAFQSAMADFDKYNLIVLPDLTHMSDDMAERIRARVRDGANAIATYRTGLYRDLERQKNYILSDLFGVDFERSSEYTHVYLNITEKKLKLGIPDEPLLIDGRYPNNEPLERSCYVKCHAGTEVLATYIEPCVEYVPGSRTERVYGHGHPYKLTDVPAITMKKYGNGICIYMGFPTGVAHQFMKSPWLERLFVNAVRMVHDPVMDIHAPSFVDANLMEKDDMYVLHLVPALVRADSKFVEDDFCLGDIECCLRLPQPSNVECLDGEVKWKYEGDRVNISIARMTGPTMVLIRK